MGGKGVEPLRTFVHTVLSRTRLPFRHSPIWVYYRKCAPSCKVFCLKFCYNEEAVNYNLIYF